MSRRLHAHPDLLAAAALTGAALLWRAVALALFPFDGLYGQDAYAYYDYTGVLGAAVAQGHGPPPFFWPLGYPLHVLVASWLVGFRPWAGQLASIVTGALVAPLTYALAREAWRDVDEHGARRAGVVAALIVALAGQSLISSVSVMADSAAVLWATLSAWLVLRYARSLQAGALALAALSLGVSIVTRWGNAVLALPWVVCVLAAWWRARPALDLRRALAHGALAVVAGGVIVGAQFATGAHTGDFDVYRWDPLNAVRADLTNVDGTYHYAVQVGAYSVPMPVGAFYAQPLVHPSYLFPLLAPFWLAGLWTLRRAARPARVVLLGWPLALYGFLAGVTYENPRFALSFFPPLAIWAGLGFNWAWQRRGRWRWAAAVLLAAGLLGSGAWSLRALGNFVAQAKSVPLAHVQYVAARVPAGSRLITFSLTATLRHYSPLDVIELYEQTPETLRAQVCGAVTPTYVYLDLGSVTGQWRGLAPDLGYRWLRDTAGLDELGAYQGYTLFRVRGECAQA